MINVAIIILNWNGTKDTLECLESIGKLNAKRYTLNTIVVDNGSTDSTNAIGNFIRQMGGSNFKLIKNKKNMGFAGGNNVGIKYAINNGADYIMVLNNDTIVDKNLAQEMLNVAVSNKNIGIVAPKIYFAPGFEFHKDRYKKTELGRVFWYVGGVVDWQNVIASHRGVDEIDSGQYERMQETDFASGCCMMVKREVFDRIGLLDGKYFLYYEDSDFSQRVKRAGFKILFTPNAFLWHKNAASAHGSGSALQDYYITRNRLLFGMRYAPLKSKLALLKESLGLLFSGRQWQKQGVVDFYLRKFGKGSYPI